MIPTIIRIAFFLMLQNSAGKGNDKDISWAMFSQPMTYTEVLFTIRGDESLIAANCITEDSYLGITEKAEGEQEGIYRIKVQFKGISPEKLSKIVTRISQQTQIVQVESR